MVIPLRNQAEDEQGGDEHATLRFSASWATGAACVTEARQVLRAFLSHAASTDHSPVPALSAMDAELVVSELVTNAIRHAPGPCGVSLRLSGDELAISVWDTSVQEPVVRKQDRHRLGGHGMYVVHAVSSRVVIDPQDTGKQITAYLRLPGDDTGSIDRTVLSTSLSGVPQRRP